MDVHICCSSFSICYISIFSLGSLLLLLPALVFALPSYLHWLISNPWSPCTLLSPHGCACSLSHLAFGLSQEHIDTAWFLSAVVHSPLHESVLVLPWWKPLIYPSGQFSLATGNLFKSQPLSRAVIGVSSSSSSLLLSEAVRPGIPSSWCIQGSSLFHPWTVTLTLTNKALILLCIECQAAGIWMWALYSIYSITSLALMGISWLVGRACRWLGSYSRFEYGLICAWSAFLFPQCNF